MQIIDTHAHIYLEQFNDDTDEMMQRTKEAGVQTILMPNVDVDTIDAMMQVREQYPELCKVMMGLHPTSVNENFQQNLDVMYEKLKGGDFCAIGEVGVDLYWDKTFKTQQIEAFIIQLNWAKELKLPVVIHARDAFDEIFEVLDNYDRTGLTGVFHSFGGNVKQGKKILGYDNFYLGISGVVTFKNSGLDKVIGELGIDQLVLETDAPYLTPAPYRGKRNEPAYLNYIVDKLSAIFDLSKDKVIETTTQNAIKLFNL